MYSQAQVLTDYKAGLSVLEISNKYGITRSIVADIVKGEIRTAVYVSRYEHDVYTPPALQGWKSKGNLNSTPKKHRVGTINKKKND